MTADDQNLAAVSLSEVTRKNWERIAALAVAPDEQEFVASNLYSLAQSKYEPAARPLSIDVAGEPVGFVMYEIDDDEPGAIMIFRFMVDHHHRGRGYGRAAIRRLLEQFDADPSVCIVRVCFVPENLSARRLYASLGFVEAGLDDDGEIIAERRATR